MLRSICFVGLVLLAACGNEDVVQPQLVPSLNIIEGDAQIDTVAKQLPSAIVAQAEDKESGAKMGNVVLNWFRVVGTDSTFLGAGLTDDTGVARLRPTLATKAGPQTFVAWALDAEGERTEFAAAGATALAGPAQTAFVLPERDSVLGGDTLRIEYGYRDAWGNHTWAGCAAPDSVGWTWDTDFVSYDSIVGFIYTTDPMATWYMLPPIIENQRRLVRLFMPNHAADVHFRAHNRCLAGTVNATTVFLRPRP